MQNIYVTQENTAQLISEKFNSRQNYSKNIKRKKLVLTQNVLKIDKTESKVAKPVGPWGKETWITIQMSTEEHKYQNRKMMWLHY